MGLSVQEVSSILELPGIDRSHGAIWTWTHTLADAQSDPPTAAPSLVAVQVEVDGGNKRLCAASDTESKLLLEIDVYNRRETDHAAFTRGKLSCSPSDFFDF